MSAINRTATIQASASSKDTVTLSVLSGLLAQLSTAGVPDTADITAAIAPDASGAFILSVTAQWLGV